MTRTPATTESQNLGGYVTIVRPTRPELIEVDHPYGVPGCTNGPTARLGSLTLATDAMVEEYRLRGVPCPETFVQIVVRPGMGKGLWVHVEPCEEAPADRLGYMAGGNTVDLRDSVFVEWCGDREVEKGLGAVSVHDRSESQSTYDAMSR